MRQIDYEILKTAKDEAIKGVENSIQQDPMALTRDAGFIKLGVMPSDGWPGTNTANVPKYVNEWDVKTKSYGPSYVIKGVFLSKGTNKIFSNAGVGIGHELVFDLEKKSEEHISKLYIVFFVISNKTTARGESDSQAKEFKKLIDNGKPGSAEDNKTESKINLSNFINNVNANAYYMKIKDKDKYVVLYEEPIQTPLLDAELDDYMNKLTFNHYVLDGNAKYYAGGTYYTQCTEQAVGSDGLPDDDFTTSIQTNQINWKQYIVYIIAIVCGIIAILMIVGFFFVIRGGLGKMEKMMGGVTTDTK